MKHSMCNRCRELAVQLLLSLLILIPQVIWRPARPSSGLGLLPLLQDFRLRFPCRVVGLASWPPKTCECVPLIRGLSLSAPATYPLRGVQTFKVTGQL